MLCKYCGRLTTGSDRCLLCGAPVDENAKKKRVAADAIANESVSIAADTVADGSGAYNGAPNYSGYNGSNTAAAKQEPKNTLAIVGLVLMFTPFFFIGLILSIAGLVKSRSMNGAGKKQAIVGIVMFAVWAVYFGVMLGMMFSREKKRNPSIKAGYTITDVTEGGTQFSLVALGKGTSDNPPKFRLTLWGNEEVDTKGIKGCANSTLKIYNVLEYISEIVIGDDIVVIGKDAFYSYDFDNVVKFELPNRYITIESGALSYLSELEYNEYDNGLYLGNGVNPYVALVKAKDTDITSLTIHNDVKTVCSGAFDGCTNLEYDEKDDGIYLGSEQNPYIVLETAKPTGDTYTVREGTLFIYDDAFDDCTGLKSITVAENNNGYATQDGILYNKSKTRFVYIPKLIGGAVTIPSGIKKIDARAFEDCDKISSVVLPEGLTEIDGYAFSGCKGLTQITIPISVTNMASYVFQNCEYLVIYCERSESDGDSYNWYSSWNNSSRPVIWDCKNNTKDKDGFEYTVSGGVRYRMKGGIATVMDQPRNLSGDIVIPASLSYNNAQYGVKIIANEAFYDCKGITGVSLPDGLTSIGSSAFYSCGSLTEITIPSSVASVGEYAFYSCDTLVLYCEVSEKPSGWNSGWNPDGCPVVWDCKNNKADASGYEYAVIDGLRYRLKEGDATVIIQPASVSGDVVIPASVTYSGDSYSVTGIERSAFYGNAKLTGITVPSSVKNIGERAFYECTYLSKVVLNSDLQSIGERAFYGCGSLTEITIPQSVTTINSYAFRDCSALTIYCEAESLSWSYSWNYDNNPVVRNCKNNNTDSNGYAYTVVSGVRYRLKDGEAILISQPKNLSGEIVIPASVSYKGTTYSVKAIDENAFYYCSKITGVTLPDGLTEIGEDAFRGCSSLRYNEYGNGRYLGTADNRYYMFIGVKDTSSSMTSFSLHANTKVIKSKAFYYNSYLTSIEIPSGVTYIGASAFSNCSNLASIEIPISVVYIGKDAFYNCNALTIYCEADSEPSGWDDNWKSSGIPVVFGYTA